MFTSQKDGDTFSLVLELLTALRPRRIQTSRCVLSRCSCKHLAMACFLSHPTFMSMSLPLSRCVRRYYAQQAYASVNHSHIPPGTYSADVATLANYAPLGVAALNGSCTSIPSVSLQSAGKEWTGRVISADGKRTATITHDRLLLVA